MSASYDEAVQIAKSANFLNRTEYALVEICQEVLVEPAATQHHTERLQYAQSLLKAEIDRSRVIIAAITIVVGNTNILDPDQVGAGVTDAQITNAIRSNWNDLAAIGRGT